ncbi:hypothetical protein FRB99_006883 [Tulasnella sp. 403]|nr:hypothetical protein FRB99_006883 [Tulasnella sp. 403]
MAGICEVTSALGVAKNATLQAAYCATDNFPSCLGICPNPDLSGVGVRAAFYMQSFMNALLITLSPEDAASGAWASAVLTGALIVPAMIQKFQRQLTLHHAVLVLNFATLSTIATMASAPMVPIWRAVKRDKSMTKESYRQQVHSKTQGRTILSLALLAQIILQWTWTAIIFVDPYYAQPPPDPPSASTSFFPPSPGRMVAEPLSIDSPSENPLHPDGIMITPSTPSKPDYATFGGASSSMFGKGVYDLSPSPTSSINHLTRQNDQHDEGDLVGGEMVFTSSPIATTFPMSIQDNPYPPSLENQPGPSSSGGGLLSPSSVRRRARTGGGSVSFADDVVTASSSTSSTVLDERPGASALGYPMGTIVEGRSTHDAFGSSASSMSSSSGTVMTRVPERARTRSEASLEMGVVSSEPMSFGVPRAPSPPPPPR